MNSNSHHDYKYWMNPLCLLKTVIPKKRKTRNVESIIIVGGFICFLLLFVFMIFFCQHPFVLTDVAKITIRNNLLLRRKYEFNMVS